MTGNIIGRRKELELLDKDEYLKIMHRRDAFREETECHSTIVPTLITTFGTTNGSYNTSITVKLDMNSMFD